MNNMHIMKQVSNFYVRTEEVVINPEKIKIKLFFFDLAIFDVMTILRDSRARIPFQSERE